MKIFQPSSLLRFGRGGAYTGRNSRGGSSEQERSADRRGAGRAEAAQSVCKSSLMLIYFVKVYLHSVQGIINYLRYFFAILRFSIPKDACRKLMLR